MLTILPLLLTAASVAVPPCTTGRWAMKASDQTIFRLSIDDTPAGPTATWERPAHFDTDGEDFSSVRGPVVRRAARTVGLVNGEVELSFDDPEPGATPDIFRLRCRGADHLEVSYQGTAFEPFDFVRAPANESAPGPWDAGRHYARVIVRQTNPEMTAIFEADQADRRSDHIDWSVVGPADEKRLRRTQQLLDAGALQSGDDYYHAAFLFQHGSAAGDYLKAHLLAMIAAARGRPGAVWIASATLDRYLQAIGKPQVLGTQFMVPDAGPATQEPYDRDLVSDALRHALHVPPLVEQEKQRQQYTAEAMKAKKP